MLFVVKMARRRIFALVVFLALTEFAFCENVLSAGKRERNLSMVVLYVARGLRWNRFLVLQMLTI